MKIGKFELVNQTIFRRMPNRDFFFKFNEPGEKVTRIFTKLRKNIQNANDNTQRMYWADAFEKLICEHF